jgi:succinoglycan biosynthesis transport protein ExoP
MLNRIFMDRATASPPPGPGLNAAPFQWLPAGIAFLRRRRHPVVACATVMLVLGAVYLLFATSRYTAVATLNIDPTRANPVGDQPVISDWQSQSAYIDSQVALIQSPATLRGVVTQIDLDHLPLFAPAPATALHRLMASLKQRLFGHQAGYGGLDPKMLAQEQQMAALSRMLFVSRVGATTVVEVRIRTPDPALSATLANAVTQAYLAQQLQSVSDTTAQAGSWLQNRVGELSGQALAADQAVQEYMAKNSIVNVTTGAGTGLMDEQLLGELNVELAGARARAAAAKARYEEAENSTLGSPNSGTADDAAANPVMAGLQQQYLNAIRQESDLASRLGPTHEAVILQHKTVLELQQSIQSENAREAAGDHADYAAAMADENAIQGQLTEEIAAEAQTNMQLSELRSLQSSADAYREIYQNFLQRFTQAMQDQSYPISNARVAAAALPPMSRSSPSSTITLAVALMLGLGIGLLIAIVQEAIDDSVRSIAQLRSATGLDYLGMIQESPALAYHRNRHAPALPENGAPSRISAPIAFREAALNPLSGIADAVQSVRIAAARQSLRGREVRVIGCVSALPDEGCSTFAANLAFALSADGQNTALVDWNTQSPWLTEILFPTRHPGLQELMAGVATLQDTAGRDRQNPFSFIGQSIGGTLSGPAGPAKIQAALAALREVYDVVVLDLPPMQSSNTAVQLSEWVDGFVLVTRWGTTPQAILADLLASPACLDAMFLGVVLNRCDAARMKLYAGDPARAATSRAPLPVEMGI